MKMIDRHLDIILGDENEPGLLDWIQDVVEDEFNVDKGELAVKIDDLDEEDGTVRGQFPSVLIFPDGDEFERLNDTVMLHEFTVGLAITSKGPRKEAMRESTKMAERIYTLLNNRIPDIKVVRGAPVEGSVNYTWSGFRGGKKGNRQLSHSKVDFTYKFKTPGKRTDEVEQTQEKG